MSATIGNRIKSEYSVLRGESPFMVRDKKSGNGWGPNDNWSHYINMTRFGSEFSSAERRDLSRDGFAMYHTSTEICDWILYLISTWPLPNRTNMGNEDANSKEAHGQEEDEASINQVQSLLQRTSVSDPHKSGTRKSSARKSRHFLNVTIRSLMRHQVCRV